MSATIFISIASFCDKLLENTVREAYTKAKHKDRVRFGIVEQNYTEARFAVPSFLQKQVAYLGVSPFESRGACWARALAMTLYNGEDWFLQIDSHMMFDQDWDETMLLAMKDCFEISGKPIISGYPKPFVLENDKPTIKEQIKGALCHNAAKDAKFKEHDLVIKFRTTPVDTDKPQLGFQIGAGFLLAPGDFVFEIPYDPWLYFHGEEQTMSLRAYTRGWDIFHAPDMPIYHLYDNDPKTRYRSKHWTDDFDKKRATRWFDADKRSRSRALAILQGAPLGIYGVGYARSLDDFIEFSGLDYKKREIRPYALRARWEDMEGTFTRIYKQNSWGNKESVSGPSSTLKYTERLRAELPKLFDLLAIQSVFDAPCGDLNWMAKVLDETDINYTGGDIVKVMIDGLKEKYKDKTNMQFMKMDLVKDDYPFADLMLSRDFLFHMSYADTYQILVNFLDSGIEYLFTTTHINDKKPFENKDIATGDFRYIDLLRAPYNFPDDPLFKILDGFDDRYMCLWSREQIQEAVKNCTLTAITEEAEDESA